VDTVARREWSLRALAAVSLHASAKECVLTVNEAFDAHRPLFFPRPEDGTPIRRAVIDAALAAVCAALDTLIRRIAAARLGCGRMMATVAKVLCSALADRNRWLANLDEFRQWSNGDADAPSPAVEAHIGPQSEATEIATEFDMLHWLGDTALSWASSLHRYPCAVRVCNMVIFDFNRIRANTLVSCQLSPNRVSISF
jgi:hypothetical protein